MRPPGSAAAVTAWTAAAALALLISAADAAASPWSVVVDGRDRTAEADPLEAAGEVLVDVAGLASVLGLEVTLTPAVSELVDRRGVRWLSRPGSDRLAAAGEMLRLPWVRRTATAWHLPAAVVADLADFELTLDWSAATAVLESLGRTSGSPPASVSGAADSWQELVIPKTAEEIAAGARMAAAQTPPVDPREVPVLPEARQSLRTTVGLGFIEGGQWGTWAAASGRWSDWTVQLSATAAAGPAGTDLHGQLFLEDPDGAWSLEAGSLYSEAWGYAEGLRVARAGSRHRPGLALYLPATLTGYAEPLLAFRDDFRLGDLSLGGEVASDGRWSFTGRWSHGRFSSTAYARDGGGAVSSGGGSVALGLGSFGFNGGYHRSGSDGHRLDSHNLRLSLPRLGRLTTTLESWGSRSDLSRSQAHGAAFGLPLGDFSLRFRYLVRSDDFERPGSGAPSRRQQELITYVGYAASPRLRLGLQVASRRPQTGEASHRADLQASVRLAAGTHLQLLGGFSSLDGGPEHYLVRWSQDLPRGLRLIAEAGDVSGFSAGRDLLGPGQEPGSIKLLLQRTWDVATPAGGGSVGGRVLAPGGVSAADVPVRLGTYRVFTDAAGRYLFRKVPPGRYQLGLEDAGLPAHLQALSLPLEVEVFRGRHHDQALFVAPLGRIGGRVYVDRDGDRRIGAGEGVGGVVLVLGEEATSTARDGSFAFHGLAAGRYRLEVATARLPGHLRVSASSDYEIVLPLGESHDQLAIRLLPRTRPIVFQETS
jgi:hypothetical protein